MRALGRSRASNDLSGFVKILADKKTDEILGVHIIGARAADLITEAVTRNGIQSFLRRYCHDESSTSNIL